MKEEFDEFVKLSEKERTRLDKSIASTANQFQKAMTALGIAGSREQMTELFDDMDLGE